MTKALTQCDYPGCRAQRKPGARFCEAHLDLSVKAQEDYNRLVNEMLASMMSEPEHEDPRPEPPDDPHSSYPPPACAPRPQGHYARYMGIGQHHVGVGRQPHYTQGRWTYVKTATIGAAELPPHAEAMIDCTPGHANEAWLLRFRLYLPEAREPFDYEGVTLNSVQLLGCEEYDSHYPGTPASHFIRMRAEDRPLKFSHLSHHQLRFIVENKTDQPVTVAVVGELGYL